MKDPNDSVTKDIFEDSKVYKLMQRFKGHPPHPVVMSTGNAWVVLGVYENLREVTIAYDWLLPTHMYEYGVFDGDNRVDIVNVDNSPALVE